MLGSKLFIEALRSETVDLIFGYTGAALVPLFHELYEAKDIRFIMPRHEQGGVHAADGYARVTGKPGTVELRDIMNSTQTQIKPVSTGEPEITKVTRGKFKGWYQTVIRFFVQQKKRIMEMTIYSKTRSALESFGKKMQQGSLQRNNTSMMKDIINNTKDMQRIQGETIRINIIIKFLQHIFNIEIGRLTPASSPASMILNADKPVKIAA